MMTRRQAMKSAAAFGAALAWPSVLDVAPHLAFTDAGGHGYAVVCASADEMEVEFVCVVRPLERSERPDGGPLAYRVTHRVEHWNPGARPRLERTRVEGELPLVL